MITKIFILLCEMVLSYIQYNHVERWCPFASANHLNVFSFHHIWKLLWEISSVVLKLVIFWWCIYAYVDWVIIDSGNELFGIRPLPYQSMCAYHQLDLFIKKYNFKKMHFEGAICKMLAKCRSWGQDIYWITLTHFGLGDFNEMLWVLFKPITMIDGWPAVKFP